MEWCFTIQGRPIPWQRARRRGKRYFTAPAQVAYQEKLRWAAREAHVPLLAGPVEVEVVVAIAHRKTAHAGGTGDGDNYLKQVGDALNGVCWTDDRQVVRSIVGKTHVFEKPFLRVRISGEEIAAPALRLKPNYIPHAEAV